MLADVETFELHPDLVQATRFVTTFYAALAPVAIADLALSLGGSVVGAVVAAVAYLCLPEVFVRIGYAGFTTPSTVLLAAGAHLALGAGAFSAPFAAGMLVALLNQKTLFVLLLFALWRLFSLPSGITRAVREPWVLGALLGTALWWAYGASVDWSTFLRDHVYYDFRDRFLFQDMSLGIRGRGWYPGVGGLWIEWARNLSPVLFALGVLGVAWGATQPSNLRFLALWAITGWILGSVTDWRQTKHLMLTIVPMVVLGQLFVERHAKGRRFGPALMAIASLYNLARIVKLWHDFDSLSPSTVW